MDGWLVAIGNTDDSSTLEKKKMLEHSIKSSFIFQRV